MRPAAPAARPCYSQPHAAWFSMHTTSRKTLGTAAAGLASVNLLGTDRRAVTPPQSAPAGCCHSTSAHNPRAPPQPRDAHRVCCQIQLNRMRAAQLQAPWAAQAHLVSEMRGWSRTFRAVACWPRSLTACAPEARDLRVSITPSQKHRQRPHTLGSRPPCGRHSYALMAQGRPLARHAGASPIGREGCIGVWCAAPRATGRQVVGGSFASNIWASCAPIQIRGPLRALSVKSIGVLCVLMYQIWWGPVSVARKLRSFFFRHACYRMHPPAPTRHRC